MNSFLMPCQISQNMMTITVKGNVLPCFEDFNEKNIMGNIFRENLKDIWNNEKYKDFRSKLATGLRHKFSICHACNRTQVLFNNTQQD